MLRELRIQNFAIIDDVSLHFEKGLNIISGDTGAGKSILVGALGLILGGRGSPDMIRTGTDQARITAHFDLSRSPVPVARIDALGIAAPDGELVVHRTLTRAGKNRIAINGDPSTVGLLSRLAENLVDIHGQHEHHSLRNRDNHIDLLDAFGRTPGLLARYKEAYEKMTGLREEMERIRRESRDRESRIDFLRFQMREIEEFGPRPGEEEQAREERGILRNAERISRLAREAYEVLYESEESLTDRAGQLLARLTELAALDPRTEPLSRDGEDLKYRLEDMAHTLRDHASRVEADPDRLTQIEERLETLEGLKRKYGGSLDTLLAFRETAEAELSRLTGSVESLARLKEAYGESLSQARTLARDLSKARARSARRMEKALEKELSDLGMAGTRFVVRIEAAGQEGEDEAGDSGRNLSPKGLDVVDFLASPNVGEVPKPLIRIASGGELSRMMLAIKTVLAAVDQVEILIFDEVDAGIGGGIAEVLGKRLAFVARGRQVICVTHQPQVASQGDVHHHIAKSVEKGRTRVTARRLHGEERVEEIARMLGGIEITDTTLQHAQEMLNPAP